MWLAAAIACLTAVGAPAGATARPLTSSAPQVALVRVPSGATEVQPAPHGTAASVAGGAVPAASAIVAPTANRLSLSLIPNKTPEASSPAGGGRRSRRC